MSAWGSCAVTSIPTEIMWMLCLQVALSVLLALMLFRLFFHSDREVLFFPFSLHGDFLELELGDVVYTQRCLVIHNFSVL